MATKFKSDRSLRRSARRIALTLIDGCVEQLAVTDSAGRDDAVHDARKSLKKLRALVRLLRPVIGKRVYHRENDCFREAGRPLTELRDAKILIETLETVVHQELLSEDERWAVDELRESLSDRLSALHLELREGSQADSIHDTVMVARKRVRAWTDVSDRWRSFGRGLEATYDRALTARQEATTAETLESLHEWRKQVRYLHEQLTFLRFLDRFRLKQMAEQADRINKQLGTVRDLSLLATVIETSSTMDALPALKSRLIALTSHKQKEAVNEASRLGDEFFRDEPSEWSAALRQDWKRVRDFVEGRRQCGDQLALPFAGQAS